MAIGYSNAVWNGLPSIKGGKRLVLLCLCDRANQNGICWPSISDTAKRAQLSSRMVKRHLKELEEHDKLISTVKQKGRNGVNVYTLLFKPDGVTNTPLEGDIINRDRVTPVTPKSLKNQQRTYYKNEGKKSAGNKPRTILEHQLTNAF